MAEDINSTTVEAYGGSLRVKGALTFATVPALTDLSRKWEISTSEPIIVDLSGVPHSDSAGLALLLQWVADVRAAGGDLKFTNIPDQVQDYIQINGLAQTLVR